MYTKETKNYKRPSSKTQTLKALNEWSHENHYLMKPITSKVRYDLNMLTVEIVFISEKLNCIAFIIAITRFNKGKWSLTSFKEMFESAHCRFNYIQEVLERCNNND